MGGGDGTPTPRAALDRLVAGNRRFVAGVGAAGDMSHMRRLEIARGQRPFATLVGCSDSRVGPELLFGTGLGDIYIVRNAGSTVGRHALGSIEYSVAELGVPLVMVLGHERCGAVMAAIDVLEHDTVLPGSMAAMVGSILPAIQPVMDVEPETARLKAAVRANVRHTVAKLRAAHEEILQRPRAEGRLWIVGAYYDLDTGRVDVFDREDT